MKKTILLNLVVLLVIVASAPAETRLVPDQYSTIQAAINDCNDGDVVIVATGTYTGPGNRDINFKGKAITVRSTDPNDPDIVAATIIDCNGTTADPHRGFYFHSGEDANSVLNGLTITNGYATNWHGGASYLRVSYLRHGGAIYCGYSSPSITNCKITGNTAKRGGGIYFDASSSKLINCTFKNNLAEQYGGGIFFNRSSPKLTNCTISDNKALSYSGGGICSCLSDPIISNCTISGNVVRREGGGICLWSSNPIIVNCIIVGNTAYDNYGQGGGISCWSSNPTIVSCTIMSNLAGDGGGAIRVGYKSAPHIINCTISQNEAANSGAALYSSFAYPTITNSIIYFNYPSEKQIILTDWNGSNLRPSICNISYSDIENGQSGVSVYHSVLNWEKGNIDADPCFADPCNGDYHLLSDSLCIDTGDPNFIAGPNDTDLDGNPRVVNGRIDMGAYEFSVSIEVPMKFTPQALNPKSKGNWVKAHLVLPEGFIVEDVDVSRPAVIEPLGIESDYLDVFINEDGLVEIEAAFEREVVCSLAGDWPQMLTVAGFLADGNIFLGSSKVRIITLGMKEIQELSYYWLSADCNPGNMCDGMDLNGDSIVNFMDFALLQRSSIEFISE